MQIWGLVTLHYGGYILQKQLKKCLKNNMEYNKGPKECIIIKYNCKEGMKNI